MENQEDVDPAPQEEQLLLAAFSERAVAFGLDVGLFTAGYLASLKTFFPKFSPLLNPHAALWTALWTALFLLYQAYFSSEGRVSVGKRIMGLRVVGLDQEPLSLGSAILRSATYLVSSVFNLGFAWSLMNPLRQSWHDLATGSLVLCDRRRSPLGGFMVRAAAAAYITGIGCLWYWHSYAEPRYDSIMSVASAKVGMHELVQLEQVHRVAYGKYTNDLDALAQMSGQPLQFQKDMSAMFDAGEGIRITTTSKGFEIRARATDPGRTLVSYRGT
jgi:uncharacterized RDD family membrane protein YckC